MGGLKPLEFDPHADLRRRLLRIRDPIEKRRFACGEGFPAPSQHRLIDAMNQRVGDVRASLELSIKLLEGRRGRGESSTRKSNPLTLVSRSIGSQPCEISASVGIPLVDSSPSGRSKNLAELRIHRNIGTCGLEHVLSIQNPALHQEGSNPSLQDFGRFLARQLTKGRAHIVILRHFVAKDPYPSSTRIGNGGEHAFEGEVGEVVGFTQARRSRKNSLADPALSEAGPGNPSSPGTSCHANLGRPEKRPPSPANLPHPPRE
jgi:hypothetical protein